MYILYCVHVIALYAKLEDWEEYRSTDKFIHAERGGDRSYRAFIVYIVYCLYCVHCVHVIRFCRCEVRRLGQPYPRGEVRE